MLDLDMMVKERSERGANGGRPKVVTHLAIYEHNS